MQFSAKKHPLHILLFGSWIGLTGCDKQVEVTSKTMTPEPVAISIPDAPQLLVHRFLGTEIYHIGSAEWNLYRDVERGRMNLWIGLECDKAIKQLKDTENTGTIPSWELNLLEAEIAIVEGFEATIPEGHDEGRGGWITNFYAGSHDGSDKNTIKVIKHDGDRLLLRLTGEVVDPNFYDNSKPRTKLFVETWFIKNDAGHRSMQ